MKEAYIKMRNGKVLDYQLLYTYATDKGMTLDPNKFMNGIQFVDINEIIENLDREFELTRLYDKDGNFIKVVE
jgi:hypothetical protein